MAQPSKLIIKHYESNIGNYVDSQYLGSAYDAGKPHVFQDTLMRIFASKSRVFDGQLIQSMTGLKPGGIKEIEADTYR